MKIMQGVLVGCGMIAREHLAAVSGLENVKMAAVCDLSPAKAEATAERFGIGKWYSDFAKMLADTEPDLVHITTPPSAHAAIARTCLSAGLNVLCEKPLVTEFQAFAGLKQLAMQHRCMLLENQNLRFHSSILRIRNLINSGSLGDVLDTQIFISLNIVGDNSPFMDRNAPHFGVALRGGVIGDFLPHLAYLTHLFVGPAADVRTVWTKRQANSPLPADEFRALVKGERATAFLGFSGNSRPDGFWVRVLGTKMQAECNLFEPPRLTTKKFRKGEQALASVISGVVESRDVLRGTLARFWRKLAGASSYDGLQEFIAAIYEARAAGLPQPISLDEVEETVRLVDRFTADLMQ